MRAFAIVPAAGLSRRMGAPKLLLPWGSATVIEAVVARWRASPVERIVVVVRRDDQPLQDRLRRQQTEPPPETRSEPRSETPTSPPSAPQTDPPTDPPTRPPSPPPNDPPNDPPTDPPSAPRRVWPSVELVLPDIDPPDMKDSVREALVYLRRVAAPGPDDVWLMAPADMPELSSRVVARLIEAARAFPGQILVPRAGGRRGHPVLFPFAFADYVDQLGPHEGLNRLLERLPTRECEWPDAWADEAAPGDLDTPADYARAVSVKAVESDGSRC